MDAAKAPPRANGHLLRRARLGTPRARALRGTLGLLAAGVALLLVTHSRLARDLAGGRLFHLPGVDDAALPGYAADERLLRAITEECAKREDTVIYVNSSNHMVVEREINLTWVQGGRGGGASKGGEGGRGRGTPCNARVSPRFRSQSTLGASQQPACSQTFSVSFRTYPRRHSCLSTAFELPTNVTAGYDANSPKTAAIPQTWTAAARLPACTDTPSPSFAASARPIMQAVSPYGECLITSAALAAGQSNIGQAAALQGRHPTP
jgi:hypothetical protein